MSRIFISYRREETRDVAGRLYDRLTAEFKREAVFRDVYTIPGGADLPTWIRDAVKEAGVILALIGDRWLTVTRNGDRRRLDDPDDWVRLEIANAIEQNKMIVPVLVENAKMPSESELPDPLRPLARRNGMPLSDRSFEADVAALIEVLREQVSRLDPSASSQGAFRGLGTFHVHIDGADEEHIRNALAGLEERFRSKSKVSKITGTAVAGPQREDPVYDLTYRYHTPGLLEAERFSVFSTTALGAGPDITEEALGALKHIITAVTRREGAVVELERVVATIDEHGVWREEDLIADPPELWAMADECDYPRLSTFPIEIHHAIDIPKEGDVPPLDLMEDVPKGPNIGGWFVFEKKDTWSYRSNQFADWSDYEHYAKDGDARLRIFVAELQARGLSARLRTLVEQVLGIWRRDDDVSRKDFKSVPDLARWELETPREFWVVAANFLGDKSPDVKNAMLRNLKRQVTYTYFVRTFADVFRLNMMRNELQDKLAGMAGGSRADAQRIVGERIRCVLLRDIDPSMRKLLEPDYFIRPDDNDHGVAGYRLQPGSIGGQKVDEARVNEIIGGLSPLLEQKVEGFYLSVRPDVRADLGQLDRYAIVCTDLEGAEAAVGHKRWRRRLALYDRIVARQVSMFRSGDVVRPVRNGYLFVFNDVVKDAADFTTRLQSAVNWHNEVARKTGRKEDILPPQVISLEFGLATHVLRAHGDDYVGEAIHRCIGRVDLCREVKGDDFSGAIAVSDDFASPYVNELGEEPFAGRARKQMQGWTMVLDRPPPEPNSAQSPTASMNA